MSHVKTKKGEEINKSLVLNCRAAPKQWQETSWRWQPVRSVDWGWSAANKLKVGWESGVPRMTWPGVGRSRSTGSARSVSSLILTFIRGNAAFNPCSRLTETTSCFHKQRLVSAAHAPLLCCVHGSPVCSDFFYTHVHFPLILQQTFDIRLHSYIWEVVTKPSKQCLCLKFLTQIFLNYKQCAVVV